MGDPLTDTGFHRAIKLAVTDPIGREIKDMKGQITELRTTVQGSPGKWSDALVNRIGRVEVSVRKMFWTGLLFTTVLVATMAWGFGWLQ